MIKFKTSLIFYCLLATVTAFSQEVSVVPNLFKVSGTLPAISDEIKISRLQTLYLQAFLSTSALVDTDEKTIDLFFDPAAMVQYRFYYITKKRKAKGERTALNSMNYFAPSFDAWYSKFPVDITVAEQDRRPVYNLGVVGACSGICPTG